MRSSSRRATDDARAPASSLITTRFSVPASATIAPLRAPREQLHALGDDATVQHIGVEAPQFLGEALAERPPREGQLVHGLAGQIGRASCRERVCQYG